MNLRRIKILAIVASSVGLLAFEAFRHLVLHPLEEHTAPHIGEHLMSGGILFVGVVAFSLAIFRLLERLHRQLVAVNAAGIAVTGDLSLDGVLERVAELARKVAGASYASVRVEGDQPRWVSSGVAASAAPTLDLPIVVKGRRMGELVLGLPAGQRFRDSDRAALETFATQAGIALENARLYQQVQDLVASRERTRIGMDLHDGVIQELYALGLKVEDAAELTGTDPPAAVEALGDVQRALRQVTGEIRGYVYGLSEGDGSVELNPVLLRLADEFPRAAPAISLELDGGAILPARTAANVLHVVREAVANALRHAGASRIAIRTCVDGFAVTTAVEDDGRGFDPAVPSAGLGMKDMRKRAEWCDGTLEIRSAPGSGTTVALSVPLPRARGAVT